MLSSSLVTGISRRGDFEVLLFNLIDWLGGKLPWDQVSPNLLTSLLKPILSTKLEEEACLVLPLIVNRLRQR
jgi:hypothetical protein